MRRLPIPIRGRLTHEYASHKKCGALWWNASLWLLLIAIEVYTGYTGFFLQAVYALSLFALIVAFWLVNRPVVKGIKNDVLQFMSCGAMAVALTGVFVLVAVLVGVNIQIVIGVRL